jgi:hypothetical protein
MTVIAGECVSEVAVTCPRIHPSTATVGDMRELFLDDHIHMALIVDEGRLVAAVQRGDLGPGLADRVPARLIGTLVGRTVQPWVSSSVTLASMKATRTRRLAVTGEDGSLLGLLCLKSTGRGFCSDADVAGRRLGRAA